MSKFVLKNANVRFNKVDLTGLLNSVNMEHGIETRDADTFDISSKRRLPGLETVSISHNGWWDNDNLEDLELFNSLTGGPHLFSVAPQGNTQGNIAYLLQVETAQYSPGAAVGDVFAFTLNFESTGKLVRGRLAAAGVKTTTGNGPALQLGALSASQSLYASLHVTGIANEDTPTLDVIVESDDNSGFSSPTTRATFSQVGANPASELQLVSGPVTDTFWRVGWTIADDSAVIPSYTIFSVLGIR